MRKSILSCAALAAVASFAAPAFAQTDAQKGLALLEQFNVIALKDLNVTNTDHVQGKVWVGGNLTGGITAAQGAASPFTSNYAELTVGGNAASWTVQGSQTAGRTALVQIGGNSTGAATLNGSGGHVDVGGTFYSQGFNPSSSKTVSTGVAGLGGPAGSIATQNANFATDLAALSSTLAGLPSTMIDLSHALSFTGDHAVFTMTAAQFGTTNYNWGNLFSSLTASQTVIINVLGSSVTEGSGANFNPVSASVIWNFSQASSVTVGNFSGSILATGATVNQTGSNIYGSVAAQIFKQTAEVHLGNFTGDARYLPPPTNDVGAVPEPASWMTMLAGFGIIGSLIRRQRRRERLAAA